MCVCVCCIFGWASLINILKVYDGLEICSGTALLSRCLRYGANFNIGAVDLEDWSGPSFKNPLDMTTSAGMAFLDSNQLPIVIKPQTSNLLAIYIYIYIYIHITVVGPNENLYANFFWEDFHGVRLQTKLQTIPPLCCMNLWLYLHIFAIHIYYIESILCGGHLSQAACCQGCC